MCKCKLSATLFSIGSSSIQVQIEMPAPFLS